jgi:hypothetical protein
MEKIRKMTTTFEIDTRELDANFVRAIKNLFKNQRVRVTIEPEIDETAYLLDHAPSHEQIQKSLAEVAKGEIVTFSPLQFNELSDSLLKNRL